MREIKLRAWDKKKKTMYYDVGLFPHECKTPMSISSDGLFYHPLHEEFGILMQFTGLKDKNGKEIYEGDVVKCNEHQGEVKWNGIYLLPFDYISTLDFAHRVRPNYIENETEIIGNIYENPELLTV